MHVSDDQMLRKAALTLHALQAHDLRKVWVRLDESQRLALAPLLDELSSLGIPKGRHWIEGDDASAISADVRDDPRVAIRAWSGAQAMALLGEQSIDTAAMVMRIEPWPWQAEVLDAWPADQRHALRGRLEASACVLPPRLADELLGCMARTAAQTRRAGSRSGKPAASSSVRRRWYHGVMSLFMLS